MKKKIITVLGTRPEIIRLSCILRSLDKSFNHEIVNTNQNFSRNLNFNFFKDLEIKKPKYSMKNSDSKNPIGFISKALIFFDKILEIEKPEAILILGDTNSSLTAICAKRKKIPIFHLEAGNRCFDQIVPEEINRKIVDHISDMNLTYSSYAENNLLREGLDRDLIIKVGSPLKEVYEYYENKIDKSIILKKLKLQKENFIIASIHREENVTDKIILHNILTSMNKISKQKKLRVIFSTHPRTLSNLNKNIYKYKNIEFFNSFGFLDYVKLLKTAKLVISDSGSITEESSILNLRSVNLRSSHERQEGMEKGISILSGTSQKEIIQSIQIALEKNMIESNLRLDDYHEKNVSDKIVNIIQSYIPYINKKIWSKN